MHVITHGSPLAPLFKNGTIIWRHVGHNESSGAYLSEVNFEKTDRESFLARVRLHGNSDFSWEPSVVSNHYGERAVYGLALFLKELPAEGWTHLIVTGVSNAMKAPYDPEQGYQRIRGGAVFAKAGYCEKYLPFRNRLLHAVTKTLNSSFEEKVKACLGDWPEGIDTTQCRLLTSTRWQDKDVLMDYCHLRLKPVAQELALANS